MTKDKEHDDVQRYYNRCRSEEIAADKERDDALIAEKERLADILEKKAGNAYYAITSVDLRQAAAILRGDEQPALKPDRAEVLFLRGQRRRFHNEVC